MTSKYPPIAATAAADATALPMMSITSSLWHEHQRLVSREEQERALLDQSLPHAKKRAKAVLLHPTGEDEACGWSQLPQALLRHAVSFLNFQERCPLRETSKATKATVDALPPPELIRIVLTSDPLPAKKSPLDGADAGSTICAAATSSTTTTETSVSIARTISPNTNTAATTNIAATTTTMPGQGSVRHTYRPFRFRSQLLLLQGPKSKVECHGHSITIILTCDADVILSEDFGLAPIGYRSLQSLRPTKIAVGWRDRYNVPSASERSDRDHAFPDPCNYPPFVEASFLRQLLADTHRTLRSLHLHMILPLSNNHDDVVQALEPVRQSLVELRMFSLFAVTPFDQELQLIHPLTALQRLTLVLPSPMEGDRGRIGYAQGLRLQSLKGHAALQSLTVLGLGRSSFVLHPDFTQGLLAGCAQLTTLQQVESDVWFHPTHSPQRVLVHATAGPQYPLQWQGLLHSTQPSSVTQAAGGGHGQDLLQSLLVNLKFLTSFGQLQHPRAQFWSDLHQYQQQDVTNRGFPRLKSLSISYEHSSSINHEISIDDVRCMVQSLNRDFCGLCTLDLVFPSTQDSTSNTHDSSSSSSSHNGIVFHPVEVLPWIVSLQAGAVISNNAAANAYKYDTENWIQSMAHCLIKLEHHPTLQTIRCSHPGLRELLKQKRSKLSSSRRVQIEPSAYVKS